MTMAMMTKTMGTGLGLAICKEIITAHKGRIWAEPGRSRGAAFHLQIPKDLDPARARLQQIDTDASSELDPPRHAA